MRLALLGAVGLAACGERVDGPSEYVGQLRVQPQFAAGTAPADVGVTIELLRIEVRRGATGAVHADTTMPYGEAEALSWVLPLESESEPVDVRIDLLQAGTMMYSGTERLQVRTGSIGSAPLEGVTVSFLGAVVDRVVVDPDDILLIDAGTTRRFTATALDADGSEIPGRTFAWSSSSPGVASVDAAGLVTTLTHGRTSIVAATGGIAGDAAVAVAVRDSVTYPFPEIIVSDGDTERSLGSFFVPLHVAELGLALRADVLLSEDDQRDEAFAVGVLESGIVRFVGDPACPVVSDDPALGRAWVDVGSAEIAAGEWELVARHAAAFPCYQPIDGWGLTNSVHFLGVRLVYYRVD